ncbi:MAG: nuclear transport factor 2 family protein [Parvibaculum sp.]|nr:nuclear transport factor 2 family protein [Parvibaculum sp.]
MSVDIIDFNARWLKAWSDKNVAELVMFYSQDTVYCDPSVPNGLKGREALRGYLTKLFESTPPMNYVPHETWATHNGYAGRWYCTISAADGTKTYMRGFDLVVLKGNEITLNEVYVHPVEKLP